ncbi:hypothetical protein QZH41_008080 [Actinostola sp. cb2023]|nr:hypothetical protein QZH41_008080 [Actinostola sp. cb2023]
MTVNFTIISSRLLSSHLLSYHLISSLIISSLLLSSHLVSYHLVSYHLISSLIISSRLLSSHLVSYHLISSLIISSLIISSRLLSSRLVSYHLISSLIISSRLLSSRLVSSLIISSRLLSSHLVSYHLISSLLLSSSLIISSRLLSSHLVSSLIIVSYHLISSLIISSLIISSRLLSSHLVSYHLVSYHLISSLIISSRLIISSLIISSRLLSSHLVSYHLVSYHLISSLVISSRLISYPRLFSSLLFRCHLIDNVIQLPSVTSEFLEHIKDLPVQAGDVFVDTYPKSGTTWLSEIVWQIYFNGRVDMKPMAERVPFLEYAKHNHNIKTKQDLHDFYLKHSPRFFKSHLQYHQVPMVDGVTKYFYVIRNPKDVAVSYYYHYKRFASYEFGAGLWDEFFEMFIDGGVQFGSWFDHVLGWWAHRDDPNILFLKYEDMKKDLPSAVQQIAEFLGQDLSVEMIQRITEQTSFTAMSGDQERFDHHGEETILGIKFVRKGEVGNWRNYFTEEQNRRFDVLYEKKMAGSGLELQFE